MLKFRCRGRWRWSCQHVRYDHDKDRKNEEGHQQHLKDSNLVSGQYTTPTKFLAAGV